MKNGSLSLLSLLLVFSGKIFIMPGFKTLPNLIQLQPINIYYLPPSNSRHCNCIPQVYRVHLSFCKIYLWITFRTCQLNSCLGDGVHGVARRLYVQMILCRNYCSRWRKFEQQHPWFGALSLTTMADDRLRQHVYLFYPFHALDLRWYQHLLIGC